MTRFAFPLFAAVMALLAAAPAAGQGQMTLSTKDVKVTTVGCRHYVDGDPTAVDKEKQVQALGKLTECLTEIRTRSTAALEAVKNGAQPATVTLDGKAIPLKELNAILIKDHLAYKKYRRWVSAIGAKQATKPPQATTPPTTPPEDDAARDAALDAARDAVEDTSKAVHDALAARGLNEMFSAALVSGVVFANGKTVSGNAGSGSDTNAAAHIAWESKHFGGDSDKGMDFSFGGRFGFRPAMTLVEIKDGAASDAADAEGSFQEAFIWDIGANWNMHIAKESAAELAVTFRTGQTVLNSQSVLVDRGANSELAVSVANGTANAEWFFEGGLRLNIFNNPLAVIHGEAGSLSPLFMMDLAIRNDSRFKQEGELAAFMAPERRFVFRFMIDALKIIDRRELGDEARTFTMGFGVEHETPLGRGDGARVPPGTKFIFKGDVNLLKAMRGR